MSTDFNTPPGFFIQVYEKHLEELGVFPAIVYGRVLRLCESTEQETGKHRNHCYASAKTIGEMLGGVDRKTIIKALKKLEETGWLECERRPGKTNIYRIPKAIPLYTHPKSGTGAVPEVVQVAVPKVVRKQYKKTRQQNDIKAVVLESEEQRDSKKKTPQEGGARGKTLAHPKPTDISQDRWNYALEKGANDPTAYARALPPNWRPKKKKVNGDPDSEENRRRYLIVT